MQTLKVKNWQGIPNKERGGYDIYGPGRIGFSGWAKTESAALEMLNDKSGATVDSYPVVKYTELEFEQQAKQRLFGGWYKHTIVKYNGIELGRIQERFIHGKTSLMSVVRDTCVVGADTGWILLQNKYRYDSRG